MSNTTVHQGSTRFAELDGLRALAVVSVILFHCEMTGVFSAGFFGVDVFFTISGFIITAILLKEYRSAGDFQFLNFYFRRLKRLLPPVLGLVLVAFLGTSIVSDDALGKFIADTPAAFLYLSNWWQIAVKQNYFDTTPHVLRHLWSLAIEEQFYIVAPPILYWVLKRGGARVAGMLALCGALASTLWMWQLYELNLDGIDQNRIYLGTDTHAMGLLIGASLACFWNPWVPRSQGRLAQDLWRTGALVALGLLGAMATMMNTSSFWLYRGAFLAVPVLTCVVAYVTMGDRAFFLSAILRTRVVQWLGLRSYSLYLVHWLVFVWMRLLGHGDFSDWTILVRGLAIVLIGAELMYRCVELPAIDYHLKSQRKGPKLAFISGYVIIAFGFSLAINLANNMPEAVVASVQPLPSVQGPVQPVALKGPAAAQTASSAADETTDLAADAATDPADANIRISGGEETYALGDSVLLGAKDHLKKFIPGIQIDAAVGRQASHGLKSVQAWRGKLTASSTVLVHLGTNGYINERQYKALLEALAVCKSVILVNVHAGRPWTAPNNEIIARMTHEFPNTHLVDWSQVSAKRPDYFVKDGIHLTRRGILAFSSQIKTALGGAPLPDAGPDAMLAGAKARRPGTKAGDGAAGASASNKADGELAAKTVAASASQATATPLAASPATAATSAASAAPAASSAADLPLPVHVPAPAPSAVPAPAPAHDQPKDAGEAAHHPTPAPASDPHAG